MNFNPPGKNDFARAMTSFSDIFISLKNLNISEEISYSFRDKPH